MKAAPLVIDVQKEASNKSGQFLCNHHSGQQVKFLDERDGFLMCRRCLRSRQGRNPIKICESDLCTLAAELKAQLEHWSGKIAGQLGSIAIGERTHIKHLVHTVSRISDFLPIRQGFSESSVKLLEAILRRKVENPEAMSADEDEAVTPEKFADVDSNQFFGDSEDGALDSDELRLISERVDDD